VFCEVDEIGSGLFPVTVLVFVVFGVRVLIPENQLFNYYQSAHYTELQ
jgi:hypothetical protein